MSNMKHNVVRIVDYILQPKPIEQVTPKELSKVFTFSIVGRYGSDIDCCQCLRKLRS